MTILSSTVAKTASVLAFGLCASSFAQDFCNTTTHSGDKKTENGNIVSSINGIGYELWYDHATSGSATFYADGSMSCSFQNAGDYLCRTGLSFNSTQTYDQLDGDIIADFKLVKQNISGADYSFVGVYGWMEGVPGTASQLVEYYVVDNWLSQYRPGDWVGNEKMGDFTIDGAEYTVFRNTRTGPAIKNSGDVTFYQYFSVRKKARECGTINVSAHMKKWAELGMKMGKLYEAKVLGEAGSNNGGVSGTADFPYAKVYVGKAGTTPTSSSSSTDPSSSSSIKSSSSGASATRAPFSGTPIAFPGTVEAEEYDIGGKDVAYGNASEGKEDYASATDRPEDDVDIINVGSGKGVGGIEPDQWMEYTINVTSAGIYNVEAMVCNGSAEDRDITLSIGGKDIASLTAPSKEDDWETFVPVTGKTIALEAGEQVLRVTFEGYTNIDYIKFSADPTAITKNVFKVSSNNKQFAIFDMQGKFIANVYVAEGMSLSAVVTARVQKSGMYLVKQGNSFQKIVVKH